MRQGTGFLWADGDWQAGIYLATDILGFSVPELCFTENDRLDITEYTQAAMVTTSIAMTKVLEENGVKPDVVAGLSLGEILRALCCRCDE